jgi:hypothetical protein
VTPINDPLNPQPTWRTHMLLKHSMDAGGVMTFVRAPDIVGSAATATARLPYFYDGLRPTLGIELEIDLPLVAGGVIYIRKGANDVGVSVSGASSCCPLIYLLKVCAGRVLNRFLGRPSLSTYWKQQAACGLLGPCEGQQTLPYMGTCGVTDLEQYVDGYAVNPWWGRHDTEPQEHLWNVGAGCGYNPLYSSSDTSQPLCCCGSGYYDYGGIDPCPLPGFYIRSGCPVPDPFQPFQGGVYTSTQVDPPCTATVEVLGEI